MCCGGCCVHGKLSRSRRLVITANFIKEAFLYAVISPVFPFSLTERLKVDKKDVQTWVTVLFSMEAAGVFIAAPIFGYLSDSIANRKIPLLFGGLVLIACHTTMCFANNLPALILGRFLQGVSAGAVWCIGLALLADMSCPARIGRTMGYVTAAYSVASLVAPSVGGVVYEKAGYYAVFGIGFGIIAADMLLRILLVESESSGSECTQAIVVVSPQRPPMSTDSGSTCSSEDDGKQIVFLEKQHSKSWVHSTRISTIERSSSKIESTKSQDQAEKNWLQKLPLLKLLKSRRMQATFLLNAINAMIFSGFDATLPIFVEDIFNWDAQGAGLIFLALGVPTLLQVCYGYLVDKFGAKWPAAAGFLITIPAFIGLRFVTEDTINQKVWKMILVEFNVLTYCLGPAVHAPLCHWHWYFTSTGSDHG